MPIEGPLKELGIHDVFQLLDVSRKTGALRIASRLRQNQGTVYFDSGAIVYARIQNNPHLLGNLLIRAGKLTEADLDQARELQQRGDGRRLGEILVELGALTPRELERYVRRQVEEVVFELMSWHEGYFSFAEGQVTDVPAEGLVRIRTEALLMEGARRIDEWSRIEAVIPHLDVIPVLAPVEVADQGQVDLHPPEWEVLAAVDGERSVRDIAGLVNRPDFDVAKIVFGLTSAGIISLVRPSVKAVLQLADGQDLGELLEPGESALRAGDLKTARTVADGAVATHPHDPEPHLLLGRICLAANHDEEAEEHLRRALRLDPGVVDAHRLLGDALARQGRFIEAVEWWQRWLTIGREVPEVGANANHIQEAIDAAKTLDRLLRGAHV